MRVLAFRHVPFEGIGHIQSAMDDRGIAVEYVDLYRPDAVCPDITAADGLIFMGGPMSANDPLSFLDHEVGLIARALDRGQPVLGVCLGSQLLARAAGAQVHRNPVKEIGWYCVDPTTKGRKDALFHDWDAAAPIFQWHSDTFDIPSGAIHLASSEACRNQAFRIGEKTYGMQFHLEITPEMIADWCTQDENCGDVCELDAPLDAKRDAVRLAAQARTVFGRWAALL